MELVSLSSLGGTCPPWGQGNWVVLKSQTVAWLTPLASSLCCPGTFWKDIAWGRVKQKHSPVLMILFGELPHSGHPGKGEVGVHGPWL